MIRLSLHIDRRPSYPTNPNMSKYSVSFSPAFADFSGLLCSWSLPQIILDRVRSRCILDTELAYTTDPSRSSVCRVARPDPLISEHQLTESYPSIASIRMPEFFWPPTPARGSSTDSCSHCGALLLPPASCLPTRPISTSHIDTITPCLGWCMHTGILEARDWYWTSRNIRLGTPYSVVTIKV